MKSLEGNEIPIHGCALRESILDKSGSLCGKCKNVLDSCKKIRKSKSLINGFVCVTSCSGFDECKEA